MLWQPLNLSAVCPPNTPAAGCSHFGFLYLNLLVQLFGDSVDRRIDEVVNPDRQSEGLHKIQYGFNKYHHYEEKKEEYDFIVVGAGSAGCVVANRLSAVENWKVLLLEAGPDQPDLTQVPGLSGALVGSNVDWNYRVQSNGKSCLAEGSYWCNCPRGKMMGGSSSINGMAYVRGNQLDYDTWAELGNVGWSYQDVLPYFKKSERNLDIESFNKIYHGDKGEQFVSRFPYVDKPSIMIVEAFNQRGLPIVDINAAYQDGVIQAQSTSIGGKRFSTNQAFIQPIRWKRHNLVVKTNSEAVKILFDEQKRAYGVVYLRNGKKFTAVARKEIIVSGGAINSPKLLMVSGVGPKKHLKQLKIPVIQDLAVGENLQDHVTFNDFVVALPNITATTVSNDQLINSVIDYATSPIKSGPLSALGLSSTMAFIRTDLNQPAPDLQIQVQNVNWQQFIRDPIKSSASNLPSVFYNGITARVTNIVPKSRGVLMLNATNPQGPPLIYPNYLDNESDLIPIIKGVRFFMSLEKTYAFRSRGAYFVRTPLPACKDYEWGTDEYIICSVRHYTGSTYHHAGSCKMGPKSDPKAVVDPTLKVHGLSNLRVIDASIMPTLNRGNTNAPSIMIGERGVAFILKYWLQKERQPYQF